jgi:hypothetical protein
VWTGGMPSKSRRSQPVEGLTCCAECRRGLSPDTDSRLPTEMDRRWAVTEMCQGFAGAVARRVHSRGQQMPPKMTKSYDAIIIGTGQAGPFLSLTLTAPLAIRITAYAVYIDPPLGRAGLTEEEVRKSGRQALIGRRPMTKVGRAVEKGETQGFMKIIVDARTREILGAGDPQHRAEK